MQPNLNDKILQARASGYSDTEIQSYLQGAGQAPAQSGGLRVSGGAPTISAPTAKPRGRGGVATSLISEAAGLAGATKGAALGAGIGSVVPGAGTIIGGVIGGIVGGFGGGFLGRSLENKVRDDEFRVKQALGEGVTSGVAGGIGGVVRGVQAAKAIKGVAEGSRLARAGVQQQISSLGIKGTGSPQTATETRRLLDVLKQVPGTNASAKLQNMPTVIARKNAEIADILSKSTLTTTKTALKQKAATKAKGLSQFLETDPTYRKALASELKELTAKFGTAKVTAAQVQTAKSSLGNKMTNIFSKIDRAVDLNSKEAARLAVWQSLDDSIIKLAPQAKQATLFLSNLRTASPAIYRASEKAFGVPLLGLKSRTAESALQTVRTIGGRASEVAGRTSGRIPAGTIPTLGVMGGAGIGRLVTEPQPAVNLEDALMGAPQMGTVSGLGKGASTGATAQTQPTNPFTSELLITAIASDPRNAALYERLYKLYEDKYKAATPKLTEAQQSRTDITDLTQGAIDLLSTGQVKTGAISGRLEQAKGIFGSADPMTLEFNTLISNLLATIAKARAGTSFTAGEKELLERYAPKIGDSGQQLRTKLALLQRQFGQPTNVTSLEEALISQTGGGQ